MLVAVFDHGEGEIRGGVEGLPPECGGEREEDEAGEGDEDAGPGEEAIGAAVAGAGGVFGREVGAALGAAGGGLGEAGEVVCAFAADGVVIEAFAAAAEAPEEGAKEEGGEGEEEVGHGSRGVIRW